MKHIIKHYSHEIIKHTRQRFFLFLMLSLGMPLILLILDQAFGLLGVFPTESSPGFLTFILGLRMAFYIISALGLVYGVVAIVTIPITMKKDKYDRGVFEIASIINAVAMVGVVMIMQTLPYANDKNIRMIKIKNAEMATKLQTISIIEESYYSKYKTYSSDLMLLDLEYKKIRSDYKSIFNRTDDKYDFMFGFNDTLPEKYKYICADCLATKDTYRAIAVRESSNEYIYYTLNHLGKWTKRSVRK